MSKPDPAFLWETAALRAASARPGPADDPPIRAEGTWVTLREAQRLTEIPVETLRKWARRGTVPTFLERRNPGTLIRKVDLDGVRARAGELGRLLPPPGQPTDFEPPGSASPTTSPGTMIIPIDAWNKMLMQLGNLHEAGQQLATARERAAKAETEAKFLRERLAEMRAAAPGPATATAPVVAPLPSPDPTSDPTPPPGRSPAPTEKVWQFIVRRLRRR